MAHNVSGRLVTSVPHNRRATTCSRCVEEQDIIKREAADAVLFYKHQLQAAQTAIQARQVILSTDQASDVNASLHAQTETSTSEEASAGYTVPLASNLSQLCQEFRPEVVQQHHVAGQLHVLHDYQHQCQQLLLQMEAVSSFVAIAVREPANSAIQIGPPDDESMLSECDTSMHDDTDIEDDTHSDDVISDAGLHDILFDD